MPNKKTTAPAETSRNRLTNVLFYLALGLIIYMPLHVLIVQSASLLTGGIEVWKAAKDVVVFLLGLPLLYLSWRRGLWRNATFRLILILGAVYAGVHGVYLLFDTNDDTYSTIMASVYNTRLLAYMLLGYLVGEADRSGRFRRILITGSLLIAGFVALFGVLQYFVLPHDFLTHFGYTLERGVKAMFFIDDKPDLPRVMSTLKDPNSLGAYLILPLLLTLLALVSARANKAMFVRPLRREVLAGLGVLIGACIILTFSRGALLATAVSIVTLLYIVTGDRVLQLARKYWALAVIPVVAVLIVGTFLKDTYLVQNLVFHADSSTTLEDPNELRVRFAAEALDEVEETPFGHGPGTAGLVAISNPQGGVLTENYYLQIAYEVGWAGIALFGAVLGLLVYALYRLKENVAAAVMLSSLAGYLLFSMLIHLWSNEAVALQWWLLSGCVLGASVSRSKRGIQ